MKKHIIFTGPATVLSEEQFNDLRRKQDANSIHRIQGNQIDKCKPLYNDEDLALRDGHGRLHYASTIYYRSTSARRTVPDAQWRDLIALISRHFTGVPVYDVHAEPTRYFDLPFAPLVLFYGTEALFPPTVVPRLDADFTNVCTDGTDQEFHQRIIDKGLPPSVWDNYDWFKERVHRATTEGGSFIVSSH